MTLVLPASRSSPSDTLSGMFVYSMFARAHTHKHGSLHVHHLVHIPRQFCINTLSILPTCSVSFHDLPRLSLSTANVKRNQLNQGLFNFPGSPFYLR